jgi:hypothetical protein
MGPNLHERLRRHRVREVSAFAANVEQAGDTVTKALLGIVIAVAERTGVQRRGIGLGRRVQLVDQS